jgi:hypothetical protein
MRVRGFQSLLRVREAREEHTEMNRSFSSDERSILVRVDAKCVPSVWKFGNDLGIGAHGSLTLRVTCQWPILVPPTMPLLRCFTSQVLRSKPQFLGDSTQLHKYSILSSPVQLVRVNDRHSGQWHHLASGDCFSLPVSHTVSAFCNRQFQYLNTYLLRSNESEFYTRIPTR